VGGRIQVSRELGPVPVPARVLNEMRGHALETLPEECCGLLVGEAPGRFREAHRCRNEMTRLHRQDPHAWPRDGSQAFHMNEGDCLRIQQHADAAGWLVTGVYHSHVEAGAYFSALDQQYAGQRLFPFPGVAHFVLSVVERRVRDVAAFRWCEERGAFEGRPVLPEGP
jgi:proteasome lid subunit RPN8/RPN11